jgi:bifunctional non-homologous end joining protein LigD
MAQMKSIPPDRLISTRYSDLGYWLKPELVAQIEFAEWTPDEHLRHSKFVGLRDDKDARTVKREE